MAIAQRQAHAPQAGGREALLDGEFEVQPALALGWLDGLLASPPAQLRPEEAVALLWTRSRLAMDLGALSAWPRELHPLIGQLLRSYWRALEKRDRSALLQRARQAATNLIGGANEPPPQFLERFVDQLWEASFAATNLPANLASTAVLLDASYYSLPIGSRVRLQGGQWELHDRNATARRNSFGKAGKARYPVRMSLRARGVGLGRLMGGFEATRRGIRIDVPGAKTLAQAQRVAGTRSIRAVTQAAYGALPLRGVLGSSAVGLIITVGPQAFIDARAAGLFKDPRSAKVWTDFALRSARSQSGNLAGIGAGMAAGFLLGLAFTGLPILIGGGIIAGIAGQAFFNAWGIDERIETAARYLLEP